MPSVHTEELYVGCLTLVALGIAYGVASHWPSSEILSPGCGNSQAGTAIMQGVPTFACEGDGYERSVMLMLVAFVLHVAQSISRFGRLTTVLVRLPLNCAALGATVCAIARPMGWCSVSCSK